MYHPWVAPTPSVTVRMQSGNLESAPHVVAAGPRPTEGFVRAFFTYGTFPIIMFGAIAAGYAFLAQGGAPKLVSPLFSTPAVLAIVVMERVHPHVRKWNVPQRDLAADVCYF